MDDEYIAETNRLLASDILVEKLRGIEDLAVAVQANAYYMSPNGNSDRGHLGPMGPPGGTRESDEETCQRYLQSIIEHLRETIKDQEALRRYSRGGMDVDYCPRCESIQTILAEATAMRPKDAEINPLARFGVCIARPNQLVEVAWSDDKYGGGMKFCPWCGKVIRREVVMPDGG